MVWSSLISASVLLIVAILGYYFNKKLEFKNATLAKKRVVYENFLQDALVFFDGVIPESQNDEYQFKKNEDINFDENIGVCTLFSQEMSNI